MVPCGGGSIKGAYPSKLYDVSQGPTNKGGLVVSGADSGLTTTDPKRL